MKKLAELNPHADSPNLDVSETTPVYTTTMSGNMPHVTDMLACRLIPKQNSTVGGARPTAVREMMQHRCTMLTRSEHKDRKAPATPQLWRSYVRLCALKALQIQTQWLGAGRVNWGGDA